MNTISQTTPSLEHKDTQDLIVDNSNDGGSVQDDHPETTSISSSICKSYLENGRRYQSSREGEYWMRSRYFLSMEAAHIVTMVLDFNEENPLFRSSIPEGAHILDVGTGSGIWATDTADKFPSATVLGIDPSPPPETWVPPNCKLEVDDVLKPWDYKKKFDLVHIRDLFASFTNNEWTAVYRQAYNHIAPGGWIEQFEQAIVPSCDDGTLPADSYLAGWGKKMFYPMCEKMGKPADTVHTFKKRIEAAGFTNVHEKLYEVPPGDWPKDAVMKEAGALFKTQDLGVLEGYVTCVVGNSSVSQQADGCIGFLLTRFGEPEPWTPEEVQVFLSKVIQEVKNSAYHAYYVKRRMWAQKPSNANVQ